MSEPTVQFTSAVPGSGKTYGRGVRFLVEEWLPYQDGDFWSNYPLHADLIADYVCKRHPKLDRATLIARMKFFPADEMKRWESNESTVADFFKGQSIAGAHIAIDEIHKFVTRDSPKAIIKKWQDWLGELRHDKATCEFLSQHEMKVNKAIRDHAGIQRFMFNTERKPDFIFGVPMEYWYELRAGFLTGVYQSKVVEAVKMDTMGKMKLVPEYGRVYPLDPQLFPLYDSYSQRDGSAGKAGGRKHIFQTESKKGLFFWFLRHNWYRVGPRFCLILFLIWVCFFGGGVVCLNAFMGAMQRFMPGANSTNSANSPNQASGTTVLSGVSDSPTSSSAWPMAATRPIGVFDQAAPAAAVKGKETEIDSLRKIITERDAEIARLKSEGARFSEIVALFGQQITLRCGVTVDVGEQIPLGPLKGRIIKGINHAKRRVILDDNTILPLSP